MTQDGSDLTLDALLRRNAARHPDRDALADPPDRQAVCADAPRRLNWRAAAAEVEAMAGVLRQSGLPQGSVVGVQLPNVVESILAPLAVMRAGMVPALIPLLWRQSECIAGLARAHAKALVVCGRVGACDHGALALDIAAELFPIRVLFGFGEGLPDGIVPLDEAVKAALSNPALSEVAAAADIITFDVDADGPAYYRRSCGELLAAGLLVKERANLAEGAVALSTLPVASFAGLAGILLPWLLTGGTLVLHHPFDPDLLKQQIRDRRPHVLVMPDAILPLLGDSDMCDAQAPASILSVARAPERMRQTPPWHHGMRLVDIAAFGETALLAQARPPDGRFAGWHAGPVLVGEGEGAMEIARLAATPHGTLAVRGALAASPAPEIFAPAGAGGDGFVDTHHPCASAGDRDRLAVTGGLPGLARIGGYAFALKALQDGVQHRNADALIAALPHALCGQRLAGHCADPAAMRRALLAQGLNPLVAQAFSSREAPAG